jgi:hypothetical protein
MLDIAEVFSQWQNQHGLVSKSMASGNTWIWNLVPAITQWETLQKLLKYLITIYQKRDFKKSVHL